MAIRIRAEQPADIPGIRDVNERAFGGDDEAGIIDALRSRGAVTLSLVAHQDARVIGHILFSPVSIESPSGARAGVALGPMAVSPEHQRQGVGSMLVHEGLRILRDQGHEAVVVLGHPSYYPRFGFVPASRFGLHCGIECPEEAFMALELRPGALSRLHGCVVRYRDEFSAD